MQPSCQTCKGTSGELGDINHNYNNVIYISTTKCNMSNLQRN